ncbi:EF-hand calcium-binding domain-containing protein 4A [Paroedura picta]|uniref:EF-hand calcium-binding domain-containing protein 4A n=1 Tax=Paroedura picta TaxID=143630 RepID=UPI0040565B92
MERPVEELPQNWLQKDEEEVVAASHVSASLCLDNVEKMQASMLEKARELFRLCDKEEKGFITKFDMQRLQSELPLTTEQLEAVFDSLEQDNNGYLTPVEFSMGLGKFIGIEQYQSSRSLRHEETFESGWSDDLDQADEEEKRFCSMIEQLEASQVFEDQSDVQELWARLQKEQPELLTSFEEFLFRISSYIKDVHHEKESIELALKRRETDHDREIRCLYEEMEQQMKAERERLLCQESMRHGRSNLLQKELQIKEQEFEKILYRQKKLEHQLQSINSEQLEMRVQNERLRQLNENLQEQVERSKWELEIARGHLEQLQKEAQLEQQQKDRDVLRVSKNMQKEKQSLLRQLELLREMNKKLRDERDAFEAKKLVSLRPNLLASRNLPLPCCCYYHHVGSFPLHGGHCAHLLCFIVIILESLWRNLPPPSLTPSFSLIHIVFTSCYVKAAAWVSIKQSLAVEDLLDCSNLIIDDESKLSLSNFQAPLDKLPPLKKESVLGSYLVEEKPVKRPSHRQPGELPFLLPEDATSEELKKKYCDFFFTNLTHLKHGRGGNMVKYAAYRKAIPRGGGKPSSLKGNTNWNKMAFSPVDTCSYSRGHTIGNRTVANETIGSSPDRVFRVVFLGNSGVGKSSFIYRFCYNRFLAEINATIGIDYQVKRLMVDNTQVVLQLWDTAGQERFQSISKQYLRRVDGFLVMYDITAECSFVAVRNWMAYIQDGIEDAAAVFLLGNKMDAAGKKSPNVSRTEGERLAKEYQAIFYECSALTGYNILEPMLHMARLLTMHKSRPREQARHLEEYHKRKECCW